MISRCQPDSAVVAMATSANALMSLKRSVPALVFRAEEVEFCIAIRAPRASVKSTATTSEGSSVFLKVTMPLA